MPTLSEKHKNYIFLLFSALAVLHCIYGFYILITIDDTGSIKNDLNKLKMHEKIGLLGIFWTALFTWVIVKLLMDEEG